MVDFVVCDLLNEFEYERADKFQLLERTLTELEYKNNLDDLSDEFSEAYFEIHQNLFLKNKNTEEKMKYLCFVHIYEKFYKRPDIYGLFSAAAAGTDSASFRVYGAAKGAGKAQVSCRAVLGRDPVFRVRSRQKSAAGGYAGKGGQLWIQQCFDAGQHFGTASGGRVSDGAVL